mmetsp:Transcript_64190/g.126980  ORF Transcript_64190/g.126980 Transcript_64190/m.126980 type:complete len:85 (+) Transcript_64190:88-342(+)
MNNLGGSRTPFHLNLSRSAPRLQLQHEQLQKTQLLHNGKREGQQQAAAAAVRRSRQQQRSAGVSSIICNMQKAGIFAGPVAWAD